MENNRNFILILFKGICNGDQRSFNTLFELYFKRLLNWGIHYSKNKEAAEEIVSDVFVKLWQNREHLDSILKPEIYLFTAVKNNALNYLNTFSRNKVVYLEDSQKETISYWEDPEKELEKKELHLKFQQAIEILPGQSKLIFRLVKEEGLKCREVAKILQISIRSVENQVFRAVKKLDKILTPLLEREPTCEH